MKRGKPSKEKKMYRLFTVAEINKAIEKAKCLMVDADYCAVRVCPEMVEAGQVLQPSFVWVDGDITDEQLDGTCGIDIDSHPACGYMGECIAVIAGNEVSWGEDVGEIIIKNAEVISVLQ